MKRLLILLLIAVLLTLGSVSVRAQDVTPTPTTKPIFVFIGDSLTSRMVAAESFPNWTVINKGIGGNHTWDMVNRFMTDVVAYHPDFAVICGGVNEFSRPDLIVPDYQKMVAMALANHIIPIVCSMIPVDTQRPGIVIYANPTWNVAALKAYAAFTPAANNYIYAYVQSSGVLLVDYFSAFPTDFASLDALYLPLPNFIHLNKAGYDKEKQVLDNMALTLSKVRVK